MEKAYWLKRKSASLEAAQNATGPEARLAHYNLAGRYSLKAASAKPHTVEVEAVPDALSEDRPENRHA